nr:MAG TPA: hypothetical protein [Bacteriophage sp.]
MQGITFARWKNAFRKHGTWAFMMRKRGATSAPPRARTK